MVKPIWKSVAKGGQTSQAIASQVLLFWVRASQGSRVESVNAFLFLRVTVELASLSQRNCFWWVKGNLASLSQRVLFFCRVKVEMASLSQRVFFLVESKLSWRVWVNEYYFFRESKLSWRVWVSAFHFFCWVIAELASLSQQITFLFYRVTSELASLSQRIAFFLSSQRWVCESESAQSFLFWRVISDPTLSCDCSTWGWHESL